MKRLVLTVALTLAWVGPAGCRGDQRNETERAIDRAYGVYEAVAVAFEDSADCASGIERARDVVRAGKDDLEAAFEIQDDPASLDSSRAALEARKERYLALSVRLEAAFGRCQHAPGIDEISAALEPVNSGG